MIAPTISKPNRSIVYPESDGQPMSESIEQLNWMIALITNLRALFRDVADVLIAGNQFWYPVEGEPDIRISPDVYAVFGRPRGIRPSYKQWLEGGLPLTVTMEILSPSNTPIEMAEKLTFYEDYGVEEYYVYDPATNHLLGYLRQGEVLRRIRPINGFVSPRLGIRFDLSGPELVVRYPDGRPFLTFEELTAEREKAEQRAARLAELSLKLLQQQATPEELQELQQLISTK